MCIRDSMETSAEMVAEIDICQKAGDTLGGVVEVLAYGVPTGLGSYVHADRRLDARLAGALVGIQAIKGAEIGDGFRTAARRGSEAHDEIERDPATGLIRRRTNRAGGIEGGVSNGEVIRVRAAMKPISTVSRALATSTVASARDTVEIGFMAARTRITSPFDTPPSMPPARLVRRRIRPVAGSRSISSCASEPRRAAVRNPSPISAPLIAWIPTCLLYTSDAADD